MIKAEKMNKKNYKCSYGLIVKSQLVILLINAKNRNLRKSIDITKKESSRSYINFVLLTRWKCEQTGYSIAVEAKVPRLP